ncbi:MAG: hypothetical protein H7201_14655 [Candidatus Saccharibacteria bacterium]|nr:hypothetical protein [Microbacteriaceae bacterium]
MPDLIERRRLRRRRDTLVALSALAQMALCSVGWYLQAEWLTITIYGVAIVLAIVTWVIPGAVTYISAERRRSAARRAKESA